LPDLISIGLAWFLAWLFAAAALHKFRAPDDYRELLGAYLPGLPSSRVFVWLPASLELGLALLLLLPQLRSVGLAGGALLLLAYAGLMGLQLARGNTDLKCGCAGAASSTTVSPVLVVRNLVCALLALAALAPSVLVSAGLAGMVLSIFIAVFSVVIYLSTEQIISNAQQIAGER